MGKGIQMSKKVFVIWLCICFLCCGCSAMGETGKTQLEESGNSQPQLIIGSDIYRPFFFQDDNGRYVGIDVELAREACRRLGYSPIFKWIDWDNKEEVLESGVVDCLWGSFTMTGREEEYLWAGPYLYTRQVVMVKNTGGILNLSDLEGKKVAVQIGSKPEGYFLNPAAACKVSRVITFSTLDEVVTALKHNYADAAAGHESALAEYMQEEPGMYRILEEGLMSVQLGVAFVKDGNQEMADVLTEALDEMCEDGTTEKIVEKYGLNPQALVWGGEAKGHD